MKLLILGASGSIGGQCLSILKKHPNDFSLVGFSVGNQTRKIRGIISSHSEVSDIVVKDKRKLEYYSKKYPSIKFHYGDEGLLEVVDNLDYDMLVNSLVGFVGLKPTLNALERNKKVALANKEALVVGGELVNKLLSEGHGQLFPIDSEHSAIWKCLKVDNENVSKLIITASGGAFRRLSRKDLLNVSPEDALKHPNWNMGQKITIDCATMINKAFEVIEAHYLFHYKFKDIKILLHDESLIHSMILYKDGTYRAEINKPDMKNPIAFAIYEGNYPFKTYVSDNYAKFGPYHFHDFKIERYPIVRYAEVVINNKGTYGAVYNAANEVAVRAFLRKEIPFLAIESLVSKMMDKHKNITCPDYKTLLDIDLSTRKEVAMLIKKGKY